MSAQTRGDHPVTVVREEIKEVVIPAPHGVLGSVYEKQRHGMGFGGGPLVDHFEHGRPFRPVAGFASHPVRRYGLERLDSVDSLVGTVGPVVAITGRHCGESPGAARWRRWA